MERKTIVIIGASGSIGNAMTELFAQDIQNHIFAFSRSEKVFDHQNITSGQIDFDDEKSLARAASLVSERGNPDVVLITTGILHDGALQPEKSIAQLSPDNMARVMTTNTLGPALVLKHFLPIMPKKTPYIMAALSARVGSITDNGLGGWYSYRASKAALNMIIKTTSIEARRKNKHSTIVGLHPGTVDSALSEPFQKNVAEGKLFTPDYSAEKLAAVVNALTPEDTGRCFAWDGRAIEN